MKDRREMADRRECERRQDFEFQGPAGFKAKFSGSSTQLLSVLLIAVLLGAAAYLIERHDREAEFRHIEIIRAMQAKCPK